MGESLRIKILRWKFNCFPAYWGTGGHITYIADDWREVRIKLPLTWRTRNYVGTIYGGSMYGVVDPIYMVMLIRLLGPEYVVWDKEAVIHFKHPGHSPLFATFKIPKEEIQAIKTWLNRRDSLERQYPVELLDNEGVVHATVEKTIYIRRKSHEK